LHLIYTPMNARSYT